MVAKRYPNHNNLNNNNITTTKEGKDAVVDFKKLKEKGEEKMLAIKEQLRDLDFEGKFIEQILKEYSPKKIEEKLDLLMEKRNIQNSAGWLVAALKNDYRGEEQERSDEEPVGESENDKCRGTMHRALNESGQIDPPPTEIKINSGDNKKILSSEEARRRFKLLRHELMAMN